ncbi:hypothetical protein [Metapseudomonas otitidis]|uniref:hypothetical protein n=1 Tax=Metapseudomonas otitidis TaxID=319939 RepID=UPI002448AC46|nr:hypothetical protein [Pseudomonas otitidis]MDG9784634.1 hypothetical protein [Pseudomonas otitidis]
MAKKPLDLHLQEKIKQALADRFSSWDFSYIGLEITSRDPIGGTATFSMSHGVNSVVFEYNPNAREGHELYIWHQPGD